MLASGKSAFNLVLARTSYSLLRCSNLAHRHEQSHKLVWPPFRADFRGQLTPRRPNIWITDRSVRNAFQSGPYLSRWLRISQQVELSDVLRDLDDLLEGASAAVYVGVPDDHEKAGYIIKELRCRGFSFHHIFEHTADADSGLVAGELIYYRWAGKGPNLVPSYATALEGIGVLVLSPDRQSVLLVWEHNNWKMITGNVDAGESLVSTVHREVLEEVSIELEEQMKLVGGWQYPKSQDKLINNMWSVFVATARSSTAKVDGIEIVGAHWFPLSQIPTLEDESKSAAVAGYPFAMAWPFGLEEQRNFISRTTVRFLQVHKEGRGLDVLPQATSGHLMNRNVFS